MCVREIEKKKESDFNERMREYVAEGLAQV